MFRLRLVSFAYFMFYFVSLFSVVSSFRFTSRWSSFDSLTMFTCCLLCSTVSCLAVCSVPPPVCINSPVNPFVRCCISLAMPALYFWFHALCAF